MQYSCTVLLDLILLLVQRRGFIDGGNLVRSPFSSNDLVVGLIN